MISPVRTSDDSVKLQTVFGEVGNDPESQSKVCQVRPADTDIQLFESVFQCEHHGGHF